MALFPPRAGQVIRYAYLWWNEARVGREDATKDRPCGVVLTRVAKSGNTIAYVLPITHTPPLNDEDGIEIPAATKQRLRLAARSDQVPSAFYFWVRASTEDAKQYRAGTARVVLRVDSKCDVTGFISKARHFGFACATRRLLPC
jgi:hypothetical protein